MREDLKALIESNPDTRELKRATAVEMWLQGYKHHQIQAILSVSSGFISKWTQRYEQLGSAALKLAYQGSSGYLEDSQRQAVLAWLKSNNQWNLAQLQAYVQDEYEVVFSSKQGYYRLFEQAGISWKKTQKCNPKADPLLVQKKARNYKLARGSSS